MKKLVTMICLLLAGVSQGATYTYPQNFSAPGYDSVRVIVERFNGAAGTWADVDSFKVISDSFPKETTLTLTLDSAYSVRYRWWAAGETTPGYTSLSISQGWQWSPTNDIVLANITQISGSAGAADSAELMLDGSGATLRLKQLVIAADGNKNAIDARGSGTGEGIYALGGTTGHGAEFKGGVTGGAGFKVEGTSSNPGLHALGSSYGIQAQGAGSYAGIFAYGGPTNGPGVLFTGQANGIGAIFNSEGTGAEIDANITGSITRADSIGAGGVLSIWNLAFATGFTAGSMGDSLTNKTFVQGSATLTAAEIMDSIMGMAVSDTATGKLMAVLLDLVDKTTDSIQLYDGRFDSLLAAASNASFLAKIWNLAFTTGFTAGSIGDSVTTAGYVQGPAAGLSAAEIMDSASNRGFVHYDSAEAILRLSNLYVIDQVDNDSAAVIIRGPSDHGLEISAGGANDAVRKISSSGHGEYVYSDNEVGVRWTSGGVERDDYAWLVTQTGQGDAIRWGTETANDSGDVFEIIAGGTDTTVHNMALQIEGLSHLHGRHGRDEHGVLLHAYNQGYAAYLYSDNSPGLRISNAGGGDSSIILGGSIQFGANQGIAGYVDSVRKQVSAVTSGLGNDRVTLYAVDTSGTDAAVSDVVFTFKDMSGNDLGNIRTKSGGYNYFDWTATDTLLVTGVLVGYVWSGMADGTNDSLIITGDQTDTLFGYNINVGSPGSANLCRLYGYIYGIDGQPVNGASVTASLSGRGLIDSCAAVALDGYAKSAQTNSVGYWYLDLVRTLCVQSTTGSAVVQKYRIIGQYPSGSEAFNVPYTVPDSTSHKMTW